MSQYCLGCDKFKSLTIYYILPNNKHYRFDLCFKCKDRMIRLIKIAEIRNGGQLEIPSYFHLLKHLVMGKKK